MTTDASCRVTEAAVDAGNAEAEDDEADARDDEDEEDEALLRARVALGSPSMLSMSALVMVDASDDQISASPSLSSARYPSLSAPPTSVATSSSSVVSERVAGDDKAVDAESEEDEEDEETEVDAESPWNRAESTSCCVRCSLCIDRRRIISSIVPRVTRRMTVTGLVWPRRCTRAAA